MRPWCWLALSNSLTNKLDKELFCTKAPDDIEGASLLCDDTFLFCILEFVSGSSNEAEIKVLALAKTSLIKEKNVQKLRIQPKTTEIFEISVYY